MLTPFGTRIIGGMFALEGTQAPHYSSPKFLSGNSVQFINARSGIALLMELLMPGRVWMPSYFCGHVLKDVGERATALSYYEVDYFLDLPSLEWVAEVQANDLVIITDYFGYPCDPECKKRVKERGAWLLEDACQALLTENIGQFADFVLFSPRKFLGVPDGGILAINNDIPDDLFTLKNAPPEWWLKAFAASVLRGEFDRHGGDRRWFELFQETEVAAPIGAYAMSELSKMLLRFSFDYKLIAERRVENYKLLASKLGEFALLPVLPEGVVPLGFPIHITDRDRVRQIFFSHNIYPPIHWQIVDVVPEKFRDSHRLSTEIMTLPCDQRYGAQDMERIIAVIAKEIAS